VEEELVHGHEPRLASRITEHTQLWDACDINNSHADLDFSVRKLNCRWNSNAEARSSCGAGVR
jgi:hypothetical protein